MKLIIFLLLLSFFQLGAKFPFFKVKLQLQFSRTRVELKRLIIWRRLGQKVLKLPAESRLLSGRCWGV